MKNLRLIVWTIQKQKKTGFTNWNLFIAMLFLMSLCLIFALPLYCDAKDVIRLEEITVTAFRENLVEQKQKEPTMKAVYTSKDLEKMNIRNAWEFMKNISGITVMEYTGGGIGQARLGFRGQMDHMGGAQYAAFLDDIPLNEPGGAGPIFSGQPDLNAITPEMIDYIEVYKGPFSTDAGDFNTAGVIKFYTKKFREESSVTAEVGSYGYNREQLTFSNIYESGFTHFTSIEYKRQDGFADNTDIDYFINANTNITYGDLRGTHTTLSLGLFSYDAQVPTGFGKDEWDAGEWKFCHNHTDGRKKDQVQAYLTNNWALSSNSNWTNQIWLRHWDGHWWEDCQAVWPGPDPYRQREQYHDRTNLGYNSKIQLLGEIWGRYAALALGLNLRRDKFETKKWGTDGHRNREDVMVDLETDYTQIGGWANIEYDLISSLRMYLGVRYDHIKYDVDDQINPDRVYKPKPFGPKTGLTWQVTDNIMIFGQAATGTRTPNPEYADEDEYVKSINYELGSKGQFFDGKLGYMISGFYNELKDVNTRDPDTKEWLFTGEIHVPGFEAEVYANIIKPITVWAVYGQNWAEYEKPETMKAKEMVGVDPWNLSVGVDWNFDFGLEGRIEYITNGKQWMNYNYDRKEPKHYQIVNINATYHLKDSTDIYLKVNNLLDERYCMWPAWDYYRPEPGINFVVGLTQRF